jgi:hypothetical protein
VFVGEGVGTIVSVAIGASVSVTSGVIVACVGSGGFSVEELSGLVGAIVAGGEVSDGLGVDRFVRQALPSASSAMVKRVKRNVRLGMTIS